MIQNRREKKGLSRFMITQNRLLTHNSSHLLGPAPNRKITHCMINQLPSPLRNTLHYQACQTSKRPNRTASTSKATTSSQARTASTVQIDLNMFPMQTINIIIHYNHSNFFLSHHRKNRDNSLSPIERPISAPIFPQRDKSKFN